MLLVDDHPDVLLLWRLILRADGGFGTIEEARDGHGAMDRLEWSCPDVLVTDYAMPGPSGLALVEAARQKRSDAIIVVSSSSCDLGDEPLRCGASAFMNKYQSTTDRLPELLHRLLAAVRSGGSADRAVVNA